MYFEILEHMKSYYKDKIFASVLVRKILLSKTEGMIRPPLIIYLSTDWSDPEHDSLLANIPHVRYRKDPSTQHTNC